MIKANRMRLLLRTLAAAVIALAWASPSQAAVFSQTFSGSSTFSGRDLSATATFTWDSVAKTLEIALNNTSTDETNVQQQVLTGLWFNQSQSMTTDHATLVGTTAGLPRLRTPATDGAMQATSRPSLRVRGGVTTALSAPREC